MTLPENPVRRKPRRLGLYAPFAALILAAAAWSLGWLWARDRLFQDMDAAAGAFGQAGYRIDWSGRAVSGYPFRLDLTITGPRLRETSGWGLAAPTLKAVANAYDLDHWVVAAPEGLALTRPGAGATTIRGQAIRASWVGEGAAGSRIAAEGLDLSFTAAPGAKPFPLARSRRAGFYTRPGPDGGVEARLMLDDAWATPGSRFGDMTGQTPIALIWQGVISKPAAFKGANAPAAARAWSAAGGAITTELGGLAAGGRSVGVRPSRLTTDADGRLTGQVALQIRGGGGAIRALGADGALKPAAAEAAAAMIDAGAGSGGETSLDIGFQDGATRLGPVTAGGSPKLF
jgi:hypothetical protein